MTTQIAILGLNLTGQSLGLALSARQFPVTGFDPKAEVAQAAQKLGAVQRTHWHMGQAVREADLTLVCLPVAEQREALAAIADDFKPGSAILCVGPLLAPPLAWTAEVLPADRYSLALHPLLSPDLPYQSAPRANLFKHGLWALAPGPTCNAEVLQLVNGLAAVSGAAPYFVDPQEHDGLMGGASGLPLALAWVLMRTATAAPGWPEMRKVADYGFATATAALTNTEQGAAALLANRAPVLRYLEAAQAELQRLHAQIANGEAAALDEALREAADYRATWLAENAHGDWEAPEKPPTETLSMGNNLRRFLVGGLFDRRK